MIKLLVTDVDGTLLPEGQANLNPEYFTVIRQLHAQGIQVVVASGRSFPSMHQLFAPVEDIVWFIADGGAAMRTTGELESIGAIPRPWIEELWQDFRNIPQGDATYCCKDVVYTPHDNTEMFTLLRDGYKMNLKALDGWDNLPEEPSSKISLFHRTDIDKFAHEIFMPKWGDRLYLVIAGEWWLDCMMPGINKGNALQVIMDQYGYTADEVLATGDNMNDMEMIQLAGTGLAVSSAREELKATADRIIPNFLEHGVLQEWKKLLI